MLQDSEGRKTDPIKAKLQEQYKQIKTIPISLAESSPAFIVPGTIGELSNKDRARVIYGMGQSLHTLQEQNKQLDHIAGYLNHYLIMITTPVSDQ